MFYWNGAESGPQRTGMKMIFRDREADAMQVLWDHGTC